MQRIAVLVSCAVLYGQQAGMPSLNRLFSRPYVWGTSPAGPAWSKNGAALVFTWNAEGNRFRDLYAWVARTKKLVRLTTLEHSQDELTAGEAEKDDRRKQYLPPDTGIASFDVSHDGTQAAFSLRGDLYVAAIGGSQPLLQLTHTKAAETAPRFSPDGKWLGSIRSGQVFGQDLQNGRVWQITDAEGGEVTTYEWSPDGKSVMFRVEKAGIRKLPLPNYAGHFVTAPPISRSVAGDGPEEEQVFVVAAAGGKAKAVERGDNKWSLIDTVWSPDSRRILISHVSPDFRKRRIMTCSAETGKCDDLFEESDERWVDSGFAGWSQDGSAVLFTSERDGWAHLYQRKPGGGDPVQITRGQYEIRNEPFSHDPQWLAGWIYYSSNEGDQGQRQFFRIHPDGSGKQSLSSGEGIRTGIVSEDGSNVALLQADETNPFDLWVNGLRVTKSPSSKFYSLPWPRVRYLHFPSKGDNKQVAAKLLLPPGYEAGSEKKWPAIVYVHGAGIATSVLKQWGSYNEMRYVFNAWLANNGYVVLDSDYRGSTGYGRDWRSDVYLHLGGKDLEDVLGGVSYLKTLGNIDSNRIGIWGVSYGGFMTAMAMFQSPGTFKAGSAWAGVYDWLNYNAGYTAQRLGAPAVNPEAYKRSSPIHFSQNLQDHLLLIHGMVDNNVLFQDAVQLTEKLVHEQKDFEHMYYPEESHGFVRDETWIDALRRTSEWFRRYLQ